MEDLTYYSDLCRAKGCEPLPEVLSVLEQNKDNLIVSAHKLLKEADLVGIGTILQEGVKSLQVVTIKGQKLSINAVRSLTNALRANNNLSKLTLSSSIFTDSGSLAELGEALAINKSLKHLDLSDNNIHDNSLTELLSSVETNQTLESLDLSCNLIESAPLATLLDKNKTLQSLEVSDNPLKFETVISVLDALVENTTLKHLGIQGVELSGASSSNLTKQEALEIKLAFVLRYSSITSISINIDPSYNLPLQDIETSIVKHNRTLQKIKAPEINWSTVKEDSPLYGILRALKANEWLSYNNKLPAQTKEFSEDLWPDLRIPSAERTPNFSFEQKEEEFIAQAYGSLPEDDKSVSSLMESCKLAYSDSNEEDKQEVSFGKYENLSLKIENLENSMKQVLEKLDKVESKFTSHEKDIQEFTEELSKTNQKINKLQKDFQENHQETLENRIKKLERKETGKVKLFEELGNEIYELREFIGDVSIKADKSQYGWDQKVQSLQDQFLSRQEGSHLTQKQQNMSQEMETLQAQIAVLQKSVQNLRKSSQNTLKTEQAIKTAKEYQQSSYKELQKRIDNLHSKDEEISELKSLTKSIQQEFKAKLKALETKLWETSEQEALKESFFNSLKNLQNRILTLETSEKPDLSHIEQRLNQLEFKEPQHQPMSISELDKEPVQEKPHIHFKDYGSQLSERIQMLEKKNIHKKAAKFSEEQPQKASVGQYLPGEAESVVVSAMLDKASRHKPYEYSKILSPLSGSLKSIANYSQKEVDCEVMPSPELQENLRMRGFSIQPYNL